MDDQRSDQAFADCLYWINIYGFDTPIYVGRRDENRQTPISAVRFNGSGEYSARLPISFKP